MSKLDKFLEGEWEDTDVVCRALHISFSQGMEMFEFSRTVEWNPAPLNGQKITTKFKLRRELQVNDEVKSILYSNENLNCPPAGGDHKGRIVAIERREERVLVMWDKAWHGMSQYSAEFAGARMARAFWTKMKNVEVVKDGTVG